MNRGDSCRQVGLLSAHTGLHTVPAGDHIVMQQHKESMVSPVPWRGRRLAPIMTTFDDPPSQKLRRPHTVETVLHERHDELPPPTPPGAAGLPRESKFNLRGLFNRSRSVGRVEGEARPSVRNEGTESVQRPLLGNTSRARTAYGYARPSVTEQPSVDFISQSKEARAGLLRGRLSRPNRVWEPPPLFQAYPQAVKHDCLQTSILSADTILRMSNNKANRNARDQMMSSTPERGVMDEDVQRRKDEVKKIKHKRRMSGSTSKPEWTQKIYVLVTSGYLLQYAADGNFDRLPEKAMQLSRDSAAFACDVIPGKHWVLQISQTATEEGIIGGNLTKSVLARMKPRKSDNRTSTSNFLLILNDPEEMDAWLVAVRKAIEALGGRKYRPGIGSRKTTEETVAPLREKPSRLYLIKRDPNQFPEPDASQGCTPCVRGGEESDSSSWVIPGVETASIKSARRQSSNNKHSMESPTISNNDVSAERTRLDRSQEGSRLSRLSSGTRTLVASRGSSTVTSSTKIDPTNVDVSSSIYAAGKMSMINTRLTANQNIPPPLDLRRKSFDPYISHDPAGHRSTHADTEGSPSLKNLSPSTPNFSVPTFSKRYSSATNGSSASNNAKLSTLAPKIEPPPTFSLAIAKAGLGGQSPTTDEQSLVKIDRSQSWTNTMTNTPSNSLTPPEHPSTLSTSQFPRRFSSLEYSRVASQYCPTRHTSQAPHPPPSFSLPAVPSPPTSQQTSPSTLPANAKKLRRPASMQVGSSKPLCNRPTTDLPSSGTQTKASAKSHNRRSRSEFAAGPPTAPPPSCPLPATPLELVSC